MVEHQLPKLRVEGSIPFTRSNEMKGLPKPGRPFCVRPAATGLGVSTYYRHNGLVY